MRSAGGGSIMLRHHPICNAILGICIPPKIIIGERRSATAEIDREMNAAICACVGGGAVVVVVIGIVAAGYI
jgi:hypothetical protein